MILALQRIFFLTLQCKKRILRAVWQLFSLIMLFVMSSQNSIFASTCQHHCQKSPNINHFATVSFESNYSGISAVDFSENVPCDENENGCCGHCEHGCHCSHFFSFNILSQFKLKINPYQIFEIRNTFVTSQIKTQFYASNHWRPPRV